MVASDERTAWRFVDFFAVTIRNPNTREAYYRAVCRFMDWCESRGLHVLATSCPSTSPHAFRDDRPRHHWVTAGVGPD